MFKSLKAGLVNFGLDMIVRQGLNQLEKRRKDIVFAAESQMINLINKNDVSIMVMRLGVTDPEDRKELENALKFLKDGAVHLLRGLILVAFYVALYLAKQNLTKITDAVKVK